MTHQQHPIGTGFTASSTVDDVLAGIDLTGRKDDEPRPMSDRHIPAEVMSHSIDPQSARRLWELSEQMIKVRSNGR